MIRSTSIVCLVDTRLRLRFESRLSGRSENKALKPRSVVHGSPTLRLHCSPAAKVPAMNINCVCNRWKACKSFFSGREKLFVKAAAALHHYHLKRCWFGCAHERMFKNNFHAFQMNAKHLLSALLNARLLKEIEKNFFSEFMWMSCFKKMFLFSEKFAVHRKK